MAMNTQNFGNLLEPILKEVFFNKYLSIESFIPKLFNEVKSGTWSQTFNTGNLKYKVGAQDGERNLRRG